MSSAPNASPHAAGEVSLALPPLREDLALHPGPSLRNGAPSWMIEDPLRGRFYRIGWLEFELLARWSCGDARALIQQVAAETLLKPELEEALAVRRFLLTHELVVDPQKLTAARSGSLPRPGLASRALHHYLMFRIPLFNPDRFLEHLMPLARPILSPLAFALSMCAALAGLALAMLQWDSFVVTFVDTLSISGLLSYAIALIFAKCLHEFGHALTAKRFGLRVPRMGVAIVLLFPMLYTDTGETWRLVRQRDRFAVAAAGMRIELMLAAWCTLAWSFLPDGPLRGACFFLATTSWLVTLAINASPFLRFDGYYMMSDATGIPNLHDEAARALRHCLRSTLLGIDDPTPLVEGEPAPRWLLVFGGVTAIYRFFLFLGIAFAVYHYFFKLLGVFLFAVEIWWFILRPIYRELAQWWRERQRIQAATALRSALLVVALLAVLFIPWQSRVFAEGWIRAGNDYPIHSPRAAVLALGPVSGPVADASTLAVLESPELLLREARASARIGALGSRLSAGVAAQAGGQAAAGSGAAGEPLVESARSTRAQLTQQRIEVQSAGTEARQLHLLAPFAGRVVDVAHDAMVGAMVARQEPLARLVDTRTWLAEVFVDEDDVRRLRVGAPIRAYLAGVGPQVIEGRVDMIDTMPIEQLPADMLAARFGGRLATVEDPASLKPRRSLYRVRCTIDEGPAMEQARLAAFVIAADRTSIADSLWRGLMSAIILQVSF